STTMVVTAIEEPTTSTLTVFPNPATDNLTIRFTSPKAGYTTVQLFNSMGISILRFTDISVRTGEQTLTVPLLSTSAGRYTLTLELPAGRQSVGVLVK
ncbi:MAG: T9SS type A sorting domain-containing protein, partial [Rudanella sp.]|nr:T9SS type A sorting domain-containing protein [Rudanella sp.]